MKLTKYINPKQVISSFRDARTDLKRFRKYKEILLELESEEKLSRMGFRRDKDMLYVGVNLNPELLMYVDATLESAELKFVSDAMRKYTDFLQKEGILDVIKADYERVYNEEFYGYVVQIAFDFQKYDKFKYQYDIGYFIAAGTITVGAIAAILSSFL